jgi:hypothetical protein
LVNHFHPVGSDTPAARAAAGYCRPSAISTQNRRRTSRRTGGDPSDPSFGRLAFPDLIRHRTSINSVLRRLLEFGRGWTCQMTDGVPYWRPPRWLDPAQTPRRNTTHHIPLNFSLPPTPALT